MQLSKKSRSPDPVPGEGRWGQPPEERFREPASNDRNISSKKSDGWDADGDDMFEDLEEAEAGRNGSGGGGGGSHTESHKASASPSSISSASYSNDHESSHSSVSSMHSSSSYSDSPSNGSFGFDLGSLVRGRGAYVLGIAGILFLGFFLFYSMTPTTPADLEPPRIMKTSGDTDQTAHNQVGDGKGASNSTSTTQTDTGTQTGTKTETGVDEAADEEGDGDEVGEMDEEDDEAEDDEEDSGDTQTNTGNSGDGKTGTNGNAGDGKDPQGTLAPEITAAITQAIEKQLAKFEERIDRLDHKITIKIQEQESVLQKVPESVGKLIKLEIAKADGALKEKVELLNVTMKDLLNRIMSSSSGTEGDLSVTARELRAEVKLLELEANITDEEVALKNSKIELVNLARTKLQHDVEELEKQLKTLEDEAKAGGAAMPKVDKDKNFNDQVKIRHDVQKTRPEIQKQERLLHALHEEVSTLQQQAHELRHQARIKTKRAELLDKYLEQKRLEEALARETEQLKVELKTEEEEEKQAEQTNNSNDQGTAQETGNDPAAPAGTDAANSNSGPATNQPSPSPTPLR
jgi:hypothetical protein